MPGPYLEVMQDAARDAQRFADLFPEIYLRLHKRRRRSDPQLTPQMWAIVQHLSLSGPLTISEAAQHFERAQSVVSETVTALEAKGFVERMPDARDRRRTLIWLTDEALAFVANERRVLDDVRLEAAMKAMTPIARARLLEGMVALVRACEALPRT